MLVFFQKKTGEKFNLEKRLKLDYYVAEDFC